jgi:hypothetical protein
MHGDGTYVDSNKSVWNGLFIEGGYDSKI